MSDMTTAWTILCALLVGVGLNSACAGELDSTVHPPVTPGSVALQDAIARGWVEYSLQGTGSSSGDAVTLRIRKTSGAETSRLVVTVPSGSVLRSSDAAKQDMAIFAVRGILVGEDRYRTATEAVLTGDDWAT